MCSGKQPISELSLVKLTTLVRVVPSNLKLQGHQQRTSRLCPIHCHSHCTLLFLSFHFFLLIERTRCCGKHWHVRLCGRADRARMLPPEHLRHPADDKRRSNSPLVGTIDFGCVNRSIKKLTVVYRWKEGIDRRLVDAMFTLAAGLLTVS